MRIIPSTKSVSLFVGISLCGVTGYLLYMLFKKDDEDDDYLSTVPKKSNLKIIEVRIPKDLVRIVIGRNGKNIKAIQEESKTRISFKDQVQDSDARVCLIKGPSDACCIAENLIQELIENQPVLECADIWVPQMAVGKIIGRCGEQIMEITAQSGAKINVTCGDRTEPTRRIMLRGTNDQINIAKSLIEDIVLESRVSQSQMEAMLAKREPRGPLKAPSPKPPLESPKVESISPIPGLDSQFEVYISAMLDPSRFWLQIVGPKATQLDLLVEEMTEYYGKQDNRDLHIVKALERGDLVTAIYKYDEKWYRAEVLNVTANNGGEPYVELYYVDYGDTDTIPCKNVFELRTDFLRLNFQAIECYLARVEPKGDDWSEAAKDRFEEWTHVAQWKRLSARMNGYCVREKTRAKREGSPVPGVDLYDVSNDHDIDIAQELVSHGLAVFKKDADVRSTSSRTTSISNSVDSSS